jgi:hypothetical protein
MYIGAPVVPHTIQCHTRPMVYFPWIIGHPKPPRIPTSVSTHYTTNILRLPLLPPNSHAYKSFTFSQTMPVPQKLRQSISFLCSITHNPMSNNDLYSYTTHSHIMLSIQAIHHKSNILPYHYCAQSSSLLLIGSASWPFRSPCTFCNRFKANPDGRVGCVTAEEPDASGATLVRCRQCQ